MPFPDFQLSLAVTGRLTGKKTAWFNLAICVRAFQHGGIDSCRRGTQNPDQPGQVRTTEDLPVCVCVCVTFGRCEYLFLCLLVLSVNNQIMMHKRKLNVCFFKHMEEKHHTG